LSREIAHEIMSKAGAANSFSAGGENAASKGILFRLKCGIDTNM